MNTVAPSDGQVSIFDIPADYILAGNMTEVDCPGPAKVRLTFSGNIEKLNTAIETADEAIERAGDHADKEWKKAALDKVWGICMTHEEFTTDLVWDRLSRLDVGTPEPRAMGAIMVQAAKRGWCSPTDRTKKSIRPECHRRPLQVWHSLIQGKI